MAYSSKSLIEFADSPSIDAFSRLRVSNPQGIFDAQFTYDLQPMVYEAITSGSGATITHDGTNRAALMTFTSTPTGGKAFLQSYSYNRYQPGKSQLIDISFNFIEAKTNCLKFVGYSDDSVNGIEFQNDGVNNQWEIYSVTGNGNETAIQSAWNLDKLNGLGPSGITLDITKNNIAIIDFQALYVGRVRVGFDFGGSVIYCHEFNHANSTVYPYLQNASLPITAGMTCTGTVSTTMRLNCASVMTEGGNDDISGYIFSQLFSGTAGNGTATHGITIRPVSTFNSIVNRATIGWVEVDVLVTGNNPIIVELYIGQVLSGTTTFTTINSGLSVVEYNTAGTLSGSPTVRIDSALVAASNTTKGVGTTGITNNVYRYPLSLDYAGAQRRNGALSVVVTGIGGTSTYQGSIRWREVR